MFCNSLSYIIFRNTQASGSHKTNFCWATDIWSFSAFLRRYEGHVMKVPNSYWHYCLNYNQNWERTGKDFKYNVNPIVLITHVDSNRIFKFNLNLKRPLALRYINKCTPTMNKTMESTWVLYAQLYLPFHSSSSTFKTVLKFTSLTSFLSF